ncbi:MAG: NAD(P)/FAD-dependent oxidoreductase [Acidobacteriota bacterium]|nr:NAD(P)/FAD-dependent oxidoreductase [Acidobacteriota bacterium]
MTSSAITTEAIDAARGFRRAPRIVILGGGYAGAYCAQALERALRGRDADVLLLDRNNFFVFYPLLVEAGTGSLEPRHTVVEIRAFLRRTRFKMAEVLEVDPDDRRVTYRIAGVQKVESARFDHLVVALGSVTRLPDVPGLARYGYQLKSLTDAVALRDRGIQLLEAAEASPHEESRQSLLHLVVVGGNFTGAEVAGEFQIFLKRATRRYPSLSPQDIRVTLIERAERILGALSPDMSAYAARKLRSRGIDVRLGVTVSEIGPDTVTLSNGECLPAATVVWCAGIVPNPLVERLPLPRDEQGYIACEHDLRVKGFDNVWAVGDVANNPEPGGAPYPATAQQAVRQGAHLAENLRRVCEGRSPVSYEHRSLGSLAALGCRTGVAEVLGIKLSGFAAWFLWRSVYLLKMPGLSRKVRVALDWTLDLVFPRETAQLGVHRRRPSS